jgi:Neuraminidase (sialidase)
MKRSIIPAFVFLLSALTAAQSLYKNVKISDENDPSEVTIAINPTDHKNMVAAANIENYYYSFDGGNTWQIRKASSTYGVWGDPCIVADSRGYFYYFHLSNAGSDSRKWLDRIVCQRSDDGGITWSGGTYTGVNGPHLQDKEWAAVDITYSPFHNNIYLAWTQCGQNDFNDNGAVVSPIDSASNIIFSFSTDAGETWSERKRINEFSGDECSFAESTVLGAVPCVGLNGEVYVTWCSPKGIILDVSTDGGHTWLEKDILVSEQPGGFRYYVPGVYRCFGFPSMACDYSSSPFRGKLYISWADQRRGTNNTDVWISSSTDNGMSWSKPSMVNNDTGEKHQFFNWMTIDQSTGDIYLVFYDRREHSDNYTDVYLAHSSDGGKTFDNQIISETPFEPESSTFMGDYTNIAATDGVIRPIWTRLENNKLSVWTAIINK